MQMTGFQCLNRHLTNQPGKQVRRSPFNASRLAAIMIMSCVGILAFAEQGQAAGEVDPAEVAEKTNKDWIGKDVLNKRAVKIGEVVAVDLFPTGKMRAIRVDTRNSGKEGLPAQLTFSNRDARLTRYHVLVKLEAPTTARNRQTQLAANTANNSREQNRLNSAWQVATENR